MKFLQNSVFEKKRDWFCFADFSRAIFIPIDRLLEFFFYIVWKKREKQTDWKKTNNF